MHGLRRGFAGNVRTMRAAESTVDAAVAGQAGLLGRAPVVVLSAALAVGPVGVVSAAQAAPPTARAPVLLGVKRALV